MVLIRTSANIIDDNGMLVNCFAEFYMGTGNIIRTSFGKNRGRNRAAEKGTYRRKKDGFSMSEWIALHHIYKTYNPGENEVEALKDASLCIQKGEFLAIVDSSGSGKSTLMNILGCLDTPNSGEYILDGEDVSRLSDEALSQIRNRKIGFVFQGFNLIPSLNALENVELPLTYRGMRGSERRRLATEALQKVGLGERLHHLPHQMSGGQQQRVAIARAIAARPAILLADEPTGNLDTRSGKTVMDILFELNREGRTVILITHDMQVAGLAPKTIQVRDGEIVEAGG